MEQRTQPWVQSSFAPEPLPVQSRRRLWPRLVWAGLVAASVFLGAQLPGLSLVAQHLARIQPPVLVSEPAPSPPVVDVRAAAYLEGARIRQIRLASNAHFIVGERLLMQRELEGAKVRATACAAADPTNPRCPALRGRIYEETKDHALAVQQYFKAIHLSPTPEEAAQISARLDGLRPEPRERF